jgi:hypothetical protein
MDGITPEKVNDFGKELESLINKHSMENTCNTPDFILTAFLLDCLQAFAKATNRREEWYGRGTAAPEAGRAQKSR